MAKVVKCTFQKSTGKQCHANAMSDSQFCFFHDPNVSIKRKEAQRSGGQKNRAAVLPSELPDLTLKRVCHVVSLLGATVNQVRKGELDPKIANCVGYLSSVLLKALETGELEERISALEVTVQYPNPGNRRSDDDAYVFVPESGEADQ